MGGAAPHGGVTMATTAVIRAATAAPRAVTRATGESRVVRWTLIGTALVFLALVLLLPLAIGVHAGSRQGPAGLP